MSAEELLRFQKTNFARHSLDFVLAKSESKRADNLPFHLSEAVKERTVSCHGCELVQLSTVKATISFSFFFFLFFPRVVL